MSVLVPKAAFGQVPGPPMKLHLGGHSIESIIFAAPARLKNAIDVWGPNAPAHYVRE